MVGILVGVPNDCVVGVGEGVGLHPVSPLGVSPTLGDDPGDTVRRTQVPLYPLVLWCRVVRKGGVSGRVLVLVRFCSPDD